MRHRTASVGLGLEDQYIGYKLGPMSSCYHSPTEGEPELTSSENLQNQALCAITTNLYLYTGPIMRDLTVEQYHMVYPEWNGSVLSWLRGEVSDKFHIIIQEEEQSTLQNAHCWFCLVSTYTILFTLITLHMSGHYSKNNEWTHSLLKTVFGKIGNRYQAYCTVYKMHAMTTHHGGTWHPIAGDVNLHIEDPEVTGMDNENDTISGWDALGGLEAEGNPNEHLPSNQATLTALTWEINKLHLWVEVGEGQPAESLDHIEQELPTLSLALQPPPSPTPTEPLREVICLYTDTLCTT